MAHPGRLDELNQKFEENPRRYFAPLANEYRKAGDFARAIELCRAHLPHQPGHMSGYIVYGQALFDAGQGNEAAEIFHQALNLDPENLIALRHLGDIAQADGDTTSAMQWYQRVLEVDPRNEEITALIATVAAPGTFTPPPPKPPVIRPEPTPDPEAVALADLMEEPDAPQAPIEVAAVFARLEESEQVFEMAPPEETDVSEPERSPDVDLGVNDPQVSYPPMEEAQATEQLLAMQSDLDEEEPEEQEFPMASPFVTETMAELYAQQGFTAEALEVYRKLASSRNEPRFHEKIRALEVRLTDEMDERAASDSTPSTSSGETVREFFVRIGALHPATHPSVMSHVASHEAPHTASHAASHAATGLGALFGSAEVDARDVRAADSLASAFSGT